MVIGPMPEAAEVVLETECSSGGGLVDMSHKLTRDGPSMYRATT